MAGGCGGAQRPPQGKIYQVILYTSDYVEMSVHVNFHSISCPISNNTVSMITGTTGMVIKLALAIYNICWHILHIYSNVNNTEYMYLSHMLRYNVMTTPFWMTYTLYWYTAAIYSSMSYTESMYCLHNFRPENIIDPDCSILYRIKK